MHHKCGAHDKGSGAGAIAYLQGLKDSKGRLRAGVEVLRGNPEQTALLIDSLKTKNKYTSIVIAFTKDDAPTAEEIQDVLEDHERVLFPGLAKDQRTHCAVQHTEDDGSIHIHIIIPRVELKSGRSLNVAPPGHEYYFAHWRDTWNYEKGWARPDDPMRARLIQPGKQAYKTAEEVRSGIAEAKDPKIEITEYLMEQVAKGSVQTREDLLEILAELGEINRVGKDYVSVRLEKDAKPIRLKGALYGDNFDPNTIRKIGAAQRDRASGREKPNPGAAEIARRELEEVVEKRRKYNENYYGKPARNRKKSIGDDDFTSANDLKTDAILDVVAPNNDIISMHSDAGNSIDVLNNDSKRSEKRSGTPTIFDKTDDIGVLQRASRADLLQTSEVKNNKKEEKNDPAGDAINKIIDAAKRAAQAAADAVERCFRAAHSANRSFIDAITAIDSNIDEIIKRLKIKQSKQDIRSVLRSPTMDIQKIDPIKPKKFDI